MNRGFGTERRKFKRVRVNFMTLYDGPDLLNKLKVAKRKEIYAVIMDLSEGGMAILSDFNMPLGTELDFKFIIPPLKRDSFKNQPMPITAKGVVRYSRFVGRDGYRLGIEFTHIRPADRAIINDVIKNYK